MIEAKIVFGYHHTKERRTPGDLEHLVNNDDIEGLTRYAGRKFEELGKRVGEGVGKGCTPVLFIEQSKPVPKKARLVYSSNRDPYTTLKDNDFKYDGGDNFDLMELAFMQAAYLICKPYNVAPRLLLEVPEFPEYYQESNDINYHSARIAISNREPDREIEYYVQNYHIDNLLEIFNRDEHIVKRMESVVADRKVRNPLILGFLGAEHVGISGKKSRVNTLPRFEDGVDFGYISPSLSVSLLAYRQGAFSLKPEMVNAMKMVISQECVAGDTFGVDNSEIGRLYSVLADSSSVFRSIVDQKLHGTSAVW